MMTLRICSRTLSIILLIAIPLSLRFTASAATYRILREQERPAGGAINSLFESDDGWMYGASDAGGNQFEGMAFRMRKDGTQFSILRSFTHDDGEGHEPNGLIEGSDGSLYGTTKYGGKRGGLGARLGGTGFGNGVVFKMRKDGTGYEILYKFTGELGDGYEPWTGVVEGPDEALYGTTFHGARMFNGELSPSGGTLYRLNKDGSGYRVLHMSGSVPNDGGRPFAHPLAASDEKLYGTMDGGGNTGSRNGTVFRINPDGTGYEILHNFPAFPGDGRMPRGTLIEGNDGKLYGTTTSGGFMDYGTVFRMNKDGSEYTIIHLFYGRDDQRNAQHRPTFIQQTRLSDRMFHRKGQVVTADGSGPTALAQTTDGTVYGVAEFLGPIGWGSIYQMDADGSSFEVIRGFGLADGHGRHPVPCLAVTSEGVVYGATNDGGKHDLGTIFAITP